MSIKFMTEAWSNGPEKPSMLLVLLALADNADDDGVCWPSYATIARKARIKERRAKQVVALLVAEGWLRKEAREGRSNMYRIRPVAEWPSGKPEVVQAPPATSGGAHSGGGALQGEGGGATQCTQNHH